MPELVTVYKDELDMLRDYHNLLPLLIDAIKCSKDVKTRSVLFKWDKARGKHRFADPKRRHLYKYSGV